MSQKWGWKQKAANLIQKDINQIYRRLKVQQNNQLKINNLVLEERYERPKRIAEKSVMQIVKHPTNKVFWSRVADFLNESGVQQEQIEKRIAQRQKFREQKANKKPAQKMQMKVKQRNKIPWALSKALREQDVKQNQRRIQKVRSYQLQKTNQYHK